MNLTRRYLSTFRKTPLPKTRTAAVHVWLGRIAWFVVVTGMAANQIAQQASYQTGQTILLTTLGIFFPLLLVRLFVASRLFPDRKLPLLFLALTIAVWAIGSATVNAASLEAQQHFPGPGEFFFLSSYLGLAAYLLSDVGWRRRGHTRNWLDVTVICGATACIASLLLVTPVQIASGERGLPLLLALIYPIADTLLAMLVMGQALLRTRTDPTKTLVTGGALIVLACADSNFALQVSTPTYDFSNLTIVLWGLGWALMVTAACRPEQPRLRPTNTQPGTKLLVGAGLIAVAVLVVHPEETLAYLMTPPAVITLVAIGARLVLALRDAKKAADALALSFTDDLTGLPNRRALRARIAKSLDDDQPVALMLLDLDGFKEINDSLGHHAGDIVLNFVANEMLDALPNDVMVARLGGDEFALVLDSTDEIELVETAHDLLKKLGKPIIVEGIEISPSGSIGITVVKEAETGINGGEVLRRADVAMYQAKSSRSRAALYDAHLDEFSRTRLEMSEDLRKAIDTQQIEVWYQPQVDARTMQVYAVEALVRWRHPVQGLISPIAFLPTARRVGLMGQLSDAIAAQAIRDLKELRESGVDLRMSLNCAPPELLSSAFLPHLYATLEACDVPADRLVLEVTEDSFLTEPQRARDILLDVHRRGIQVSIDDYGTGFSSLTYLRNLPVHELKIDRSLVHDITTDERSRKIVAYTIDLAHALDMRTVAEGVEDAETQELLIELGIDSLQGYHLAKPMPATELNRWLRVLSITGSGSTHPEGASALGFWMPESRTEGAL